VKKRLRRSAKSQRGKKPPRKTKPVARSGSRAKAPRDSGHIQTATQLARVLERGLLNTLGVTLGTLRRLGSDASAANWTKERFAEAIRASMPRASSRSIREDDWLSFRTWAALRQIFSRPATRGDHADSSSQHTDVFHDHGDSTPSHTEWQSSPASGGRKRSRSADPHLDFHGDHHDHSDVHADWKKIVGPLDTSPPKPHLDFHLDHQDPHADMHGDQNGNPHSDWHTDVNPPHTDVHGDWP
jgi:hypothetical protein